MTIKELWTKLRGEDNLYIKLLCSLTIIGAIFLFAQIGKESVAVHQAFDYIKQLGWWAPVFFTALYILISGILLPSVVFKIFAGTLFGVFNGVVIVSIASTISSLIKFLLARYFFRDTISKKIARNPKLKAIDQIIEEDGWKMLVLLRNVPVASSLFLNYICGVTKMKTKDFILASFLGRLPITLMYVYLGYLVGYTAGMETNNGVHNRTIEWIALAVGLAATIGATYYVIHLSKKIFLKRVPATVCSA